MIDSGFIIRNEAEVRLFFFVTVFITMAGWEMLAPRRRLSVSKSLRWLNHFALMLLNTLLLRLLFPAAAVGVSLFAEHHSMGLLNFYGWQSAGVTLLAIVLLDMAIYLQHVMFHAMPLLWRLHRVHHADPDFDVTTGSRFHPLEMILSMLIKFAVILLLGAPAEAVIIFEVLLNVMAMFNHANVHIHRKLDRVLRWFIVTPDMHRVHHSIEEDEANSNFGFNLSWWDYLFGTARSQPRNGHENMVIGIRAFRNIRNTSFLDRILLMPMTGRITGYAINRRYETKNVPVSTGPDDKTGRKPDGNGEGTPE